MAPHSNSLVSVIEQTSLWGDYGCILVSGNANRSTGDGLLRLQRSGPFLPPVFFPWTEDHRCIVVSDDFRRQLGSLPLTGIEFRPTILDRIVRLDWHLWDLDDHTPQEVPEGGEPTDYFRNKRHCQATADKMPKAWELRLPRFPFEIEQSYELDDQGEEDYSLPRFTCNFKHSHLPALSSTLPDGGEIVAVGSMRDWLLKEAARWIVAYPIEQAELDA